MKLKQLQEAKYRGPRKKPDPVDPALRTRHGKQLIYNKVRVIAYRLVGEDHINQLMNDLRQTGKLDPESEYFHQLVAFYSSERHPNDFEGQELEIRQQLIADAERDEW